MKLLTLFPLAVFRDQPRLGFRLAVLALSWGASSAAAAPLSLEEAVHRALAKNYTISIGAVTPQIARAQLLAAWGRFDPSIELSTFYAEDGNPQPADPFSGSRPPSSLIKAESHEAALVGLSPWGLSYRLGGSTQNRRGTFNAFADQFYSFAGISLSQPILRNFGFGVVRSKPPSG